MKRLLYGLLTFLALNPAFAQGPKGGGYPKTPTFETVKVGATVTANKVARYSLVGSGASALSQANTFTLSRFEGGAGVEWTKVSGTDPANDTTHNYDNSRGILLASTGADSKMDKTLSTPINATGAVAVRLTLWVNDLAAIQGGNGYFTFYLASTAWSANYQCFPNRASLVQGRNDIWMNLSDCTATGSPNVGSISAVRIWARSTADHTLNIVFSELALVKNPNAKASILFTFDDGYASWYDTIRPILDQAHMAASGAVVPAFLEDISGDDTFMTTSEARQLQDAYGWDIVCHTYEHVDVTTLTAAQIDSQYERWLDWAAANGIARVPVMVYPWGNVNQTARDETAKYFRLGRATMATWTNPDTGTMLVDPATATYRLPVRTISNTTTLASVQTLVDTAVTSKGILIILLHNVTASPAVGNDWSTANFQSLVDYVKTKVDAGTAEVLTFSQLLDRWYPQDKSRW